MVSAQYGMPVFSVRPGGYGDLGGWDPLVVTLDRDYGARAAATAAAHAELIATIRRRWPQHRTESLVAFTVGLPEAILSLVRAAGAAPARAVLRYRPGDSAVEVDGVFRADDAGELLTVHASDAVFRVSEWDMSGSPPLVGEFAWCDELAIIETGSVFVRDPLLWGNRDRYGNKHAPWDRDAPYTPPFEAPWLAFFRGIAAAVDDEALAAVGAGLRSAAARASGAPMSTADAVLGVVAAARHSESTPLRSAFVDMACA